MTKLCDNYYLDHDQIHEIELNFRSSNLARGLAGFVDPLESLRDGYNLLI